MMDARAGEFLGALFDGLDGHIEVRPMLDVASGEPRPKRGEPKRHWYAGPDSLVGKLPELALWGKANRHAMFFGVLPRQKGRGKAVDCLPSRVVWADTDWKAHAGGEIGARDKVGRFPILPTIVVRSAHGLHLYWILDEVLEPAELSKLSKMVGRAIGGDAVHNPDRLLRLPGSWNMKDPDQPIRATIESIRKERISPAVLRAAAERFGPKIGDRTDRGAPFKAGLLVDCRLGERMPAGDVVAALEADLAGGNELDGKLKITCPFQKDATPGSGFLKLLDGGGVFIQCMSKRHDHWTGDGVNQWWLDDPKRAKPSKKRKSPERAGTAPGVPIGAEPEVWGRLDFSPRGLPRASPLNVWRVLENDSRWGGRLYLNELDGRVYLDGKPMTDATLTRFRRWMDEHYGMRTTKGDAADVACEWAAEKSRHPLRTRLESLEWDTDSRAATLLPRYFGAADTPLNREIGKRWLISAVARVFQPGCQVDTVLILQGPQGVRKSSAFRALAMRDEWFSDTAMSFARGNDALEKIRGVWIYELAELTAVRRTDVESVKAFVSSRVDRYREAYGRFLTETPRQCVIVGSTNEAEFLVDGTGSRRFWPVAVGTIDLEAIKRDREELWAEAVAFYRGGERWWLEGVYTDEKTDETVAFTGALEEASAQFNSGDPWDTPIRRWVHRTTDSEFTIAELLKSALDKDADRLTRMDSMRVAGILAAMGCKRIRVREAGGRVRKWTPPDPVE